MTPEPSPLVSFEVPMYFWYETPVGWLIVALMLLAFVGVAAVLVRWVWMRFKR